MTNPKFQRLLMDYRLKSAEEIFTKAEFNNDVFMAAVEKVHEEQKIKKEITEKYDKDRPDKRWQLNFNFKTKKGLAVMTSLVIFISIIIIFVHLQLNSKKDRVPPFYKK
jgi:hypothetical protein